MGIQNSGYEKTYSVAISTRKETLTLPVRDIVQLYFIEDIFSFSLTGKMIFNDRNGIIEDGPFTGTEKITILYGDSGIEGKDDTYKPKRLEFYIYKVNKILPRSPTRKGDENVVEVILVDEFFHRLHSKKFSLSFSDIRMSDIVKHIAKNHCGIETFGRFEATKEKIDFFDCSLKSPSENIKWVMDRSSGITTKTAGYLFYRTTEEKPWQFQTLESLLGQKGMMGPEGERYLYNFDNPNVNYINKVLSYSTSHVDHSQLKNLISGTRLGYDTKRKLFLRREYNYEDILKEYTILGNFSLFPKGIPVDQPKETNTGEDREDYIDNLYKGDWIKRYCMQLTVSLVVKGHEDRHAGGMIEIEWPSGDSRQKMFNKNMMGKYLVKSVTHNFSHGTTPTYTQKLICIKNGYYDSDEEKLVKAVKVNKSQTGGLSTTTRGL